MEGTAPWLTGDGSESGRIARLAGTTTSGGYGEKLDIDSDDIRELLGDSRGARAVTMLSLGQRFAAAGDKRGAGLIEQGKSLLRGLELDKGTSGELRAASMIIRNSYGKGGGATDEERQEIRDAVGIAGKAFRTREHLATAAVIKGRMSRLSDQLGSTGLASLTASGGLGRMVGGMISGSAAGAFDGGKRSGLLRTLALAAGKDPKQARRIASLLGGGSDISSVLQSMGDLDVDIKYGAMSEEVAGDSTIRGGRRIRKATRGVFQTLMGMGLAGKGGVLSQGDARALVLGADQAGSERIGKIRERMIQHYVRAGRSEGDAATRAGKIIKEMESGITATSMTERRIAAATSRGLRTLSKDVVGKFGFSKEFQERLGKLTSMTDDPMLQQNLIQTSLLQKIANNTGTIDPRKKGQVSGTNPPPGK